MSGPPKRPRLDDPAPSTEEQLAELLDRLRREQSSASSASPALNSRQTPRATTEPIPTPTIQTPAHGHTSSANTTSTGAGRSAAPATEISSAADTPTNNLGTEGITAALAATLQTLTAGQSAGGAWQPNRGRGRGGRRFIQPARNSERGMLTIFVCVQHDIIYCQQCNHYEPVERYWERHPE